MYYIVNTHKSFEQASKDLALSIAQHGFGLLSQHNLGKTLRDKGLIFTEECNIFEICHPGYAAKVMAADMNLNMALPCRISVYTVEGQTRIGLIRPLQMLSALTSAVEVFQVAKEVECNMIKMVDEAK